MKQLKFNPELVPLVLDGSKTVTWRLFDDKNLSEGDELEFIDSGTGNKFARALVKTVTVKPINMITVEDQMGHEQVGEGDVLLKYYQSMYRRPVSQNDEIKVIKFVLQR